jgi:hypothetical protein
MLPDFQKLHCADDHRNEMYEVPLSVARTTEFAHKNLIITRRVVGKQLVKLHKEFSLMWQTCKDYSRGSTQDTELHLATATRLNTILTDSYKDS